MTLAMTQAKNNNLTSHKTLYIQHIELNTPQADPEHRIDFFCSRRRLEPCFSL